MVEADDTQMTPQEMFDKAYIGVVKQGCKSTNFGGGCLYRGVNNTKCGIGFLIPDDIARAWDKRRNNEITKIKSTKRYPVPKFIVDNILLAGAIQRAHDGAHRFSFIRDFKKNMQRVANAYNLTIPNVEQQND